MRVRFSPRGARAALVTCAVLIALVCALPSWALALTATPRVQQADVRVTAIARSASRSEQLPIRADLLGVTWTGGDALQLRTRSHSGGWSSWIEVEASGDGPDPSSAEGRHASTRHTVATPIIVSGAERVQVRRAADAHGAARDVQLQAINVTGTASRGARVRTSITSRVRGVLQRALPAATAVTPQPMIRDRASWGAAQPAGNAGIAEQASGVVVHHTVSTNNYACASVPALLRGIQRYHIKSNKWFDIGYNFVVDRCGGVWEARSGGITQAVIGAHTAGFNTGTVGIALLGTHSTAKPTLAARRALQRLIAWRMDVAHVLPSGTMKLTARSGDKFPVGKVVTVRAVSGHRDLFPTSCPGGAEYVLLTSDAAAAYRLGGLKVANITTAPSIDPVSGVLRSTVIRSVSTNRAALMRIALERSSTGEVLAQLSGRTNVLKLVTPDLTARSIPAWDVRVRVTAAMPGQRARTYLEPLKRYSLDPGFAITQPPAAAIAPGQILSAGYALGQAATIGAELYDPTTGLRVLKLATSASNLTAPTSAGTLHITIPSSVATGTYELRIGVASDTAPGRSIKRYTLTVDPSVPPTTATQ